MKIKINKLSWQIFFGIIGISAIVSTSILTSCSAVRNLVWTVSITNQTVSQITAKLKWAINDVRDESQINNVLANKKEDVAGIINNFSSKKVTVDNIQSITFQNDGNKQKIIISFVNCELQPEQGLTGIHKNTITISGELWAKPDINIIDMNTANEIINNLKEAISLATNVTEINQILETQKEVAAGIIGPNVTQKDILSIAFSRTTDPSVQKIIISTTRISIEAGPDLDPSFGTVKGSSIILTGNFWAKP